MLLKEVLLKSFSKFTDYQKKYSSGGVLSKEKIFIKILYIISSWIFNSWMLNIQKIWKKIITVNWDFSQTRKPVFFLTLFTGFKINLYETPIYGENFGEVSSLPCFPRKMVLYSSSQFCIFEPSTNIQSLRKFDLRFWQILDQVHRKLQHKEKIFEKF